MMFHLTAVRCFLVGMLSALAGIARAEPPIDFSRDIQPILSDNCFHCHGPAEKGREADLRLDDRDSTVKHRDDHYVVLPGKSGESELMKRIVSTDDDLRMPPPSMKRTLKPEQIALLKRWIDEGAVWGRHWAHDPPKQVAPPEVKDVAWTRNEIDRFLLARLERERLAPSAEASRETLIRRVTLDLTGIPPTPEEFDAFLADTSPEAYERLVDRLLASPRYGERMVWDWLDAARYADTNGYQGDQTRTMWPWRDWAVAALNRNLPFDSFTREQLAGDLLPEATRDNKIATGFCRNHMINGEGGRIAEENRIDYVMDQAETTATVWMGATFNCCRCHDHKFDAYTQKDYYGLFGFFNQTPVDGGGGNGQTAPVVEILSPEDERRREELSALAGEATKRTEEFEQLLFPRENGKTAADSPHAASLDDKLKQELRKPVANRKANEEKVLIDHFQASEKSYADSLAALSKAKQDRDALNGRVARVMVMQERPQPRDTFRLDKGLYNKPLDKVATAVPACLPPLPQGKAVNRLALAEWLLDRNHPLTSRVAVNRLWQQIFGVGLVKTADDFGVQGEKPSHPELLDWLAVEFMRTGWDVKHMQRLIVTSAAYRQSSRVNRDLWERDPENRLLARGPRSRMPSFMLRDQALAAAGLLVERIGGPGVNPYQPSGVWEDATFGGIRYTQDHGENLYRRSVYTFWRRIIAPTAFFDSASRQNCSVKQGRTNTPLHALAVLNDVTYVEAARVLAERILLTGGASPEDRIATMFRIVLARKPRAEELPVLVASLQRLQTEYAADRDGALKLLVQGESKRNESLDAIEHAAYTGVCMAIFNLDEALTKE